MKARDFYLEVAFALSGCQLVEQELKLYLTDALDLAKKCIGDRLPFKFNGEDYNNSSLERLIDAFRKLSNNPDLISALNKFKEERNFLSHKAISHCLDYDHELSIPDVSEIRPRLTHIQKEADRLREAIHEEASNFRGHLWFGEFGNEG